ncbi:MAG: hypothetical protein AAFN80_15210 [Pseudomonadota bacterium]
MQVVLDPYLPCGNRDDERSYAELRRQFLRYFDEGWDITIGADRVFWGVVESVNKMDVINQRDGPENADLDKRLGRSMLRFSAQINTGNFDVFYFPCFP